MNPMMKRLDAIEAANNSRATISTFSSDDELKAYIRPSVRELQAKPHLTDTEQKNLAMYLDALGEEI